jgi:aspartate dehydrogenase
MTSAPKTLAPTTLAPTTAVGLIGYGGIARDVATALRAAGGGVKIVASLCRPGAATKARAAMGEIAVVESLAGLLALRPAIVAEVAGQQAVAEHGPGVLRAGIDLLVISVGALADPALLERLKAAAHEGKSRILLPAGAIGGIDAIAAMRLGGLAAVRYRSRKPPAAWRGSPAEKVTDLDKLTERTVLYRGNAGEAALLYPQNANVAAAIALAGLGFEKTEVELVADPAAPGNVHEIEAEGAAGRFAIQLQGRPSRTNPKTSALAALSVARALINLDAAIVI